MGCDIHLHTEVKINGEWHHYSSHRVNRNYDLFAKMAGVRGTETPIAEPRGLPEDVTFVTKFDSDKYGEDGHTHSWLDANEIKQLYDWYADYIERNLPDVNGFLFLAENFGFVFGDMWDSFVEYPEDIPDGVEDIRFVFWFDN